MFDSMQQIVRRLGSYPWFEVALELFVIWLCVYLALRFLRGTRGAGVIRGFALLLVILTILIRVLGEATNAFGRLNFIYGKFLGLLAILLIVVFQPELRRAMVRLGSTRLFRPSARTVLPVVDSVADAVQFLSKNKFGALIAIERDESLSALAGGGVRLHAEVSARLLQSIFWPNNPLHDLGVVVSGDRVLAASVQFPLAEEGAASADLGSRHRAGLGLSTETDALIVIVSEETGQISLAEFGRFERNIPRDEFRSRLLDRLRTPVRPDDEEEDGEADDAAESAPDGKTSADAEPVAVTAAEGESENTQSRRAG